MDQKIPTAPVTPVVPPVQPDPRLPTPVDISVDEKKVTSPPKTELKPAQVTEKKEQTDPNVPRKLFQTATVRTVTQAPEKEKRSLLSRLKGIPKKIFNFIRFLPRNLIWFFRTWLWQVVTFTGLLFLYMTYHLMHRIVSFRLIPVSLREKLLAPVEKIYSFFTSNNRQEERTINRVNLIDLAMRNMLFKRSRAVITVGGMAIGIGAIVFLVSIGFGLQELVTRRVARLDELSQADMSTQPGSKEKITDQTLARLKDLKSVDKTLPLIASVARVNFQNSISDMAVYAVTTDYLKQSAIKPIQGTIFSSNEISLAAEPVGQVAGLSIDTLQDPTLGGFKGNVEFTIYPEEWIKVREEPTKAGKIIGYTKRVEGVQTGKQVWGNLYAESNLADRISGADGTTLSPWISASFALWDKKTCEASNPDCVDGGYIVNRDPTGQQVYAQGFSAQVFMDVTSATTNTVDDKVLGLTTDEEAASMSAGIVQNEEGWVTIASESAGAATEKITKVDMSQSSKKEAVVNTAMLQILGLKENEAVGKKFSSSFVIVGDLLEDSTQKLESNPVDYTIVGVVPDDKTPYFYVPFIDLRSLGVRNYSQVKVVVKDSDDLSAVRKQIESIGYATRSVADTVKQIDRLFVLARTALAVIGTVALAVAALGMFNTLTVSLLERTREVGLMKAMGMKSHEVQELFLTESMVMGFFGGVLGIAIGYSAGKLIGLFLSIFSVSQGAGYIDIAYLPPAFTTFIFLISLVVGIVTGIYPARRATKISALNALRYE